MVDDLEPTQIGKLFEQHQVKSFNLIEAVKRFGGPPGWELVLNEYKDAYLSPTTGGHVSTLLMHFERDEE